MKKRKITSELILRNTVGYHTGIYFAINGKEKTLEMLDTTRKVIDSLSPAQIRVVAEKISEALN